MFVNNIPYASHLVKQKMHGHEFFFLFFLGTRGDHHRRGAQQKITTNNNSELSDFRALSGNLVGGRGATKYIK